MSTTTSTSATTTNLPVLDAAFFATMDWKALFESKAVELRDHIDAICAAYEHGSAEDLRAYVRAGDEDDQSVETLQEMFEVALWGDYGRGTLEFYATVLLNPGKTKAECLDMHYPSNIKGVYLYDLNDPEDAEDHVDRANDVFDVNEKLDANGAPVQYPVTLKDLPAGIIPITGPTWADLLAAVRKGDDIMCGWYQKFTESASVDHDRGYVTLDAFA